MNNSKENFYVVSTEQHNSLVKAAYMKRGYSESEALAAARLAEYASRHGIRTHNAIKALHLDHLFGSGSKGCVPDSNVEIKPSRFASAQVWDANRKLGQAVAFDAMEACIEMADKTGVGIVSVNNAFHYLWGGAYVMDAAKRGYIAYTNCTAALAEVVPFLGKFPTLGTNPHSWGFPTTEAVGFPIVVDWATSVVSMGRVQQLAREGLSLPPGSAIDEDGNETTVPSEAKYLLPFGGHKGYGLSLVDELLAAMIGGGLPTVRSRWTDDGENHAPCFFFQVIHPDAVNSGEFSGRSSQGENLRAVIQDILGHGNENCLLPGEIEAEAAKKSAQFGGLLFSGNEIEAFNQLACECGHDPWSIETFKLVE